MYKTIEKYVIIYYNVYNVFWLVIITLPYERSLAYANIIN